MEQITLLSQVLDKLTVTGFINNKLLTQAANIIDSALEIIEEKEGEKDECKSDQGDSEAIAEHKQLKA